MGNLEDKMAESKATSKADKLPHFERAYKAFMNRREEIIDHVRALEAGHPGAATTKQIVAALDTLLTLMQVIVISTETDPDAKEYYSGKGFFGIPDAPEYVGEP